MSDDRLKELEGAVILSAWSHTIMLRLPSGEERFLQWDYTDAHKGFYHEPTEEASNADLPLHR